MAFKKATKEACKARVALYGPSGAGKTMTALRMAHGMGKSIAVIDTENHSAAKYSDRYPFEVCELEKATVSNLVSAINEARGYDVLIIDSMTHSWQELLQEVEKLANAKYKGNTWSAWSEGTPKQKQLVSAILNFPGHVIATMRTKTEWVMQDSGNGRTKPVRVGLSPEQGKGIEYEFDILISISVDHVAHVEKDRSSKFQDQIIDKPGEDFGRELAAWLSEGAAPQPRVAPAPSTEPEAKSTPPKKRSIDDVPEADRARCMEYEAEINLASTVTQMEAIGFVLASDTVPKPVKDYCRPIYAAKMNVLKGSKSAA